MLLKKMITTLIVVSLWAAVVNPVKAMDYSLVVPTSVQQQEITPEQMGPFLPQTSDQSRYGTRGYFDDNNPRINTKTSKMVTFEQTLQIGANPQVSGGLNDNNYRLGADEAWYTLTVSIVVITIDFNGRAYMGRLMPGEIVLIDKNTGMIKAIRRCGNWARQIGARFTLTCPTTEAGPCKPDPRGMTERSRNTVNHTNGDSELIVEESDDCKTTITKTITKKPVEIDNTCKPGLIAVLVKKYGYKKPVDTLATIKAEMASVDWARYGKAITDLVTPLNKMATDIVVQVDGCNVAVYTMIIKDGGIPKWVWFAMAGLFVAGIFIGMAISHGEGPPPSVDADKVTNKPPIRPF